MSLFSKPTEIIVAADDESLIWSVQVSGINTRNVVLTVGDGCQAILMRDGEKKVYFPGKHTIEWRKSVSGHTVSLYGVNVGQRFTLKFGAGNIPYEDWEINETPYVGVHGECEVTVLDGASIKGIFGPGFETVSISGLRSKIIGKAKEIIKGELANTIKNYSYSDVNGMIGKLSDGLKSKFSNEFIKDGITITRCSIIGIHFPEGYAEHRQEVITGKKADREKKAQHKSDMEIISRFSESKDSAKVNISKENNRPVYCPLCGQENPAGTKFCKNCGIKIN